MKILLVEDDEDKRELLNAFISREGKNVVTEALSLQSGLRKILTDQFDLIVLDMTMPTFDITPTETGGRPQPFGGRELLQQMARRGIRVKTIVVSQFDQFGQGDEVTTLDELDKALRNAFPDVYLGAIPYSVSYSGWKEEFEKKMIENNIIL